MTITRRGLIAAVAAPVAAAALLFAPVHAQTVLSVDGAWARPTVQGQAGGGGFFRISGGASADRLVSASADISRAVELHSMQIDGTTARMRQLDAIDVPAGKLVELKPGGLHVMFIGLTRTLKSGDHFPLTLRFERAGEVMVEVKVMMTPAAADASHTMHKP